MPPEKAAFGTETSVQDDGTQSDSVLALWHLLSLDAPCVAALWSVLFARLFRVPLPWTAPLALAIAVWMLYAADRLADATAGKAFEERHRFHQRKRAVFAACWLACAPVLLLLVLHLPHALRDGWLLLAIPLAAYVGAVHALRLSHMPKEPLIAVFFGMAVAMPVVSSGLLPPTLTAVVVLFASLCWLNCAAIAAWESPSEGYVDPMTRLLGRHFLLFSTVALLLSLWISYRQGPSRWVGLSVAASLILLMLLGKLRGHLDRTHVRALSDAALLTPLLVLPLLAWHTQ